MKAINNRKFVILSNITSFEMKSSPQNRIVKQSSTIIEFIHNCSSVLRWGIEGT